jgi:hypothetical protein
LKPERWASLLVQEKYQEEEACDKRHPYRIIIIIIINVSNIPGNHEVRELQKTAILGTAHVLRKVLM